MQYAVRGSVVIAADQIASDLETNPEKYPFKEIIFTNIGNPHQVGQKCLTWPRQVLALCDLPAEVGVDHPSIGQLFPKDAIARAREIKDALGVAGTGAYSHSKGHIHFRKDVARFIEERDGGVVCDPECLFLTNGASSGINMVLTALIADENSGVMIPIPQYPIYSATIDILNGKKVGYFLDEKKGWDLNIEELERSLAEAKEKGINVNSFVLINPGNPTGQVLSEKAVQDIVTFCSKHNLVLLADEVYQENVYKGEFVSCKKAAHDLGLIDENKIELVSFHSCSKGLFGECGRRGGYMELVGFEPEVIEEIYKLASSGLCAGLAGQIMLSLMVRGPQPGDESYESHQKERNDIYDSLKRRSKTVSDGLDAISGFSCEPTQGAMYCFPSVQMPPKAIQEAEEKGISPDTLYALSLLEYSGICVVPASGFGQEEGRYGFRTTFLPSEDKIANAVELFRKHHESFCEKYN
eukprot:CAMPEP_0172487578 /NCGR_PEP_ID=MMETSP1066-20121228/16714_1 /TAXON_ID=671091 /ORGANISM="Coscinodiscus wailesii, Strain CCMP2513" /LENGTH=467 /DNA_ID=CAMNT_0013254275 /DNA_START=230 /DNA_END=1633 /DNA_ORIENTATION=-